MSSTLNHIGEQFGDYRLLRLIGTGGFGQVYLGEHIRDNTPAAIKVLQTQLSTSKELKEFLNEARTFRLNHPNIIRLLDFGIGANDVPYLAMDYAPYGTLRDQHPKGTRVPLQNILSYIMPVASALQYAHEHRLVHRDIKPENMLVGPQHQIWLSDFGIVTAAHSSQSMQPERVVGTWSYMAPEQIRGKPRPASDQYALGVVVYEWLCGKRPFTGTITEIAVQHIQATPTPLRTYIPGLPIAIEDVVLTALEKEPKNRFDTIQDFAEAFRRACPPSARPSTQHVKQRQPAATQPRAETPVEVQKNAPRISRRALVGGLAAVAVGSAGTYYFLHTQTNNTAHSVASPIVPAIKPTSVPTPLPIGTLVFSYNRHKSFVYSAHWSSQDQRIVTGSDDKTAQVWDALNGGNFIIYTGHTDRVNGVSWSPDDQYIVSCSSDKTAQIWNSMNGNPLSTYQGHTAAIFAVAWSPKNQLIASGGLDLQVHIWDSTTQKAVYIYKGHKNIVNKAAWSPDGLRIASVSNDMSVQVWDANNGGNAYIYNGHKGSTRMVAWSPDGKRIASVGDDRTVQVWNAIDGGNAFTYTGHKASVSAVAWSPDGKRIASSSDDKTVQVWDAVGGGNLFTYTGHKGAVFSVDWSHNGKYIVSGGDQLDPTAQVWSA